MAEHLAPLVGRWRGTWRTWVEPEELHDASAIDLEVVAILGGRDLHLAYASSNAGDPVEGKALIGSAQGGGAVMAWTDTWHTSGLLLTLTGERLPVGVRVATEFLAEGQTWTWSMEITREGAALALRCWNEGPDVPRYLGVEAVLDPA